jgi:segregation and condensation protein B
MKIENAKSLIESMLFAAGRIVSVSEMAKILEMTPGEVDAIVRSYMEDCKDESRGIEVIRVNDGYQMTTKKSSYDCLVQLFDNRSKPFLSSAALEILAIIAYNPKITRAEIEAIRGVNSDGTLYRLNEFHLIEEAGKMDAPGRPTMYKLTDDFFKMFGISSLDELPELPQYKLDENEQIVLEEMKDIPTKENNED